MNQDGKSGLRGGTTGATGEGATTGAGVGGAGAAGVRIGGGGLGTALAGFGGAYIGRSKSSSSDVAALFRKSFNKPNLSSM